MRYGLIFDLYRILFVIVFAKKGFWLNGLDFHEYTKLEKRKDRRTVMCSDPLVRVFAKATVAFASGGP